MHITIVKTKDGKEYLGWIKLWRPEENCLVLVIGNTSRKFSFDELQSAITKGERISIKSPPEGEDCDEIERARKYVKQGREFNWFKQDVPVMEWEK